MKILVNVSFKKSGGGSGRTVLKMELQDGNMVVPQEDALEFFNTLRNVIQRQYDVTVSVLQEKVTWEPLVM